MISYKAGGKMTEEIFLATVSPGITIFMIPRADSEIECIIMVDLQFLTSPPEKDAFFLTRFPESKFDAFLDIPDHEKSSPIEKKRSARIFLAVDPNLTAIVSRFRVDYG